MILAIGLVLFILSAPVLLTRVSPSYRAETHLMLLPLKQPSIQGRDRDAIPGDLRDYMRTLSNRITSYNILAQALDNIPADQRPDFLHPDDPVAKNVFRLMGRIRAQEISGTYLLTVSIEGGDPTGLDVVLNTLTDTFLKQLHEEQEEKYSRQFSYLEEERERILHKVDDQRAQLVVLADAAGQRAFLHKAYDAHLNRLSLLQKSYWDVETDRIQKQRDLKTIESQNTNLALLSLKPAANRKVSENFGINQMERWTYENLQDLRSTIDGLTPENRERRYVETRMGSMQEYLTEYRGNVQSNTLVMLVKERDFLLSQDLIKAQAAAQAAAEASTLLLSEKVQAEQQASDISGIIFSAQQIVFNIDQLQTRLAALDSRLDDNQLQAKAPLPIHIDRKAQPPGMPFESNQKKLIVLAFMLSFGFVGAFCFLFDLLDNRIRSRQDIERLIKGTIPEPLPLIEEATPENWANAMRCDLTQRAAILYRQLAVRLYPEQEQHHSKIFCLSGTEEQVGTSTLAANLAECFSAYGNRVLLLELNQKSPAPFWTAPDSTHSIRAVLAPDSNIKELAFHDEIRGIDVLPAGQNRNEILPITGLTNVLKQARKQYDWVLLDCAPFLDDDMARFAAQQSDGILLTVKEDLSSYGRLCSTKNLLESYEVPAMTVVLTGARRNPGEWLGTTVQSALSLLTFLHKKLQDVWKRIRKQGVAS